MGKNLEQQGVGDPDRMRRFAEFTKRTGDQIQVVAQRLGKNIADSMDVQEALFRATRGDWNQVKPEMIEAEFNKPKDGSE